MDPELAAHWSRTSAGLNPLIRSAVEANLLADAIPVRRQALSAPDHSPAMRTTVVPNRGKALCEDAFGFDDEIFQPALASGLIARWQLPATLPKMPANCNSQGTGLNR